MNTERDEKIMAAIREVQECNRPMILLDATRALKKILDLMAQPVEEVRQVETVAWRYSNSFGRYYHYGPSDTVTPEIIAISEPLYAAPPPWPDAHPDDIAVDNFAAAMKAKLAKKRGQGYGGWDDPNDCPIGFLVQKLEEHVRKGDVVDIANFCMMLHQRGKLVADLPKVAQTDAQTALDAARYRWLRDENNRVKDTVDNNWEGLGELSNSEFDKAIDEAIAQSAKGAC
jgi:hypothetical protein